MRWLMGVCVGLAVVGSATAEDEGAYTIDMRVCRAVVERQRMDDPRITEMFSRETPGMYLCRTERVTTDSLEDLVEGMTVENLLDWIEGKTDKHAVESGNPRQGGAGELEFIFSPKLRWIEGNSFTARVQDNAPVDYFVPVGRDSLQYDLKKQDEALELTFSFYFHFVDVPEGGLQRALTIEIGSTSIVSRRQLGALGAIGKPKVKPSPRVKATVTPGVDAWEVLILPELRGESEPGRIMFVFFRARRSGEGGANSTLAEENHHVVDGDDARQAEAARGLAGEILQCTTEFTILRIRHEEGPDALMGLASLEGAQLLSGDADAFLPSGELLVGDEPVVQFSPDGTVESSTNKVELLSAPRVTTCGPPPGAPKDPLPRSEPVRGGKAGLFDCDTFLFRDVREILTGHRGKDVPSEHDSRVRLKPSIIADVLTEHIPYLDRTFFGGPSYVYAVDPQVTEGILCCLATDVLDNGDHLETDVLFRMAAGVTREPAPGTYLPVGRPKVEGYEFLYRVAHAPGQTVGFAFPQYDFVTWSDDPPTCTGHVVVLMKSELVVPEETPEVRGQGGQGGQRRGNGGARPYPSE